MGRFSEALAQPVEPDETVPEPVANKGRFSVALTTPQPLEGQAVTQPGEPELISEAVTAQPGRTLGQAIEEEITPTGEDVLGQEQRGRFEAAKQGVRKTGQGFTQMALEAGKQLNLVDEETLADFTNATEKQREEFSEAFREEFGDNVAFDVADAVAQIGIGAAVPGGAATAGGRLALGAGTGAAFGGAQFRPSDSEDTLFSNVATGAAIGGGAASLGNLFSFAKDYFRKSTGELLRATGVDKLGNEIPVVKNEAGEWISAISGTKVPKEVKIKDTFAQSRLSLGERTDVPLKLSQVTDDPAAIELERIARGTVKGERMARQLENKQLQSTLQFWERTARNIQRGSKTFGEDVGKAINTTLNGKDKGLFAIRRNNASKNFGEVEKLTGGKKVIPVSNFKNQLDSLTEEAVRRPASPDVIKELSKIREEFADGRVDALEMQKLLQKYGKASKGTGRIFSDKVDRADDIGPAKSLFKAINDDLDSATGGSSDAARALRLARDKYQQDTSAINAVRDSALGKLLNKKVIDKDGNPLAITPEIIEQQISRMSPESIKSTMAIVSEFDPVIKKKLQRFWVERFIDKAKVRGEAGAFPLDPDKLVKMKSDPNFNVIFQGDPSTKKLVQDGIDIARTVSAQNIRSGGRFFQQMQNAAGVAASMDKTFVARLATELFTPRAVAKYVIDDKGLKALQEFAKPFNQNAWAASLVQLKNISEEQ